MVIHENMDVLMCCTAVRCVAVLPTRTTIPKWHSGHKQGKNMSKFRFFLKKNEFAFLEESLYWIVVHKQITKRAECCQCIITDSVMKQPASNIFTVRYEQLFPQAHSCQLPWSS